MKLSLRVSILAGTLAALTASAPSALAQSSIAKAKVPFEFAAGGAMMPPGDYTIVVSDISGAILLRGPAGNSIALLATFSGEASHAASKLVFEQRDGMPYLCAVDWPDQSARVISPFKQVTRGLATAALR